jgi:branched-subunit amino acid aminotransferase/4-amino-4-deoxychorismate lyase
MVGGTSSNVFVVQGSRLSTPALGQYGVRGIMRSVVMNQCTSLGLECVEADLRVGELEFAEEVFISNALTGIRPVLGLEGKDWPRGPVTRRLCAALAAAGVTECAAHC